MQDTNHNHNICGNSATTSALVGLAPTYWAHVPMCIAQIHQLQLLCGIHCLVFESEQEEEQGAKDNPKIVPISRCRVVGCIVSLERKASGSALYVLDDGTGLLDCVSWQDDVADALPPLVDSTTGDSFSGSDEYCQQYQVGDTVEVFGRIECVAVLPPLDKDDSSPRCCIRELHLTMLRPLPSCTRALPGCLDSESKHMIQASNTRHHQLTNAMDVLEWLGSDISLQIQQREHFPSVHDTVGAWRLFGIRCPCDCQDLKDALLYCHCIAKKVDLDPDWRYRDAFLRVLLEMEKEQNGNGEKLPPRTSEKGLLPLFVHYQELVSNGTLEKQAKELGHPAAAVKQVLLRTIRALCDDGILHLYDAESDTYLLISRSTVLEPYVRLLSSKKADDIVVRSRLHAHKPVFLHKVPKARLQLIRRQIAESDTMDAELNE